MGCGTSKTDNDAPDAAPKKKQPEKSGTMSMKKRPSLSSTGASIRERRKIEFTRLMDDEVGLEYLLDFSRSELSEENMMFWMDVMKFKRLCAQVAAANVDEAMAVKIGESTEADQEVKSNEGAAHIRTEASRIIDTYLRDGADMLHCRPGRRLTQVSVPDHPFKKKAAETLAPHGKVQVEKAMFDKAQKLTYKNIEYDTFKRFRLSDKAKELAERCTDESVEDEKAKPDHKRAQDELRAILDGLQGKIGFERATVWLHDADAHLLWSIQSTELGNTTICINVDNGLVGKAVKTGADLICVDAYDDTAFSDRVDKATGFRTRSVLCVTLKQAEQVRGVVQLINKKGEGKAHLGEGGAQAFVEADCQAVHSLHQQLTDTLNSCTIHKLLT